MGVKATETVTVYYRGEGLLAERGAFLSEVIHGEKPCGGRGKCGKCKVIVTGDLSPVTDTERAFLSDAELLRGVRLSCLTRVMGDCRVFPLVEREDAKILTAAEGARYTLFPTFRCYGVAIDVGTTTVVGRLYDTHGVCLSADAVLNPQSEWGADVISRIEASMRGAREALAKAIRAAINRMLSALAERAGISSHEIDRAVITGNTVMLSLLSKEDVTPFSHAPFTAERLFDEAVCAKDLWLDALLPETPIVFPPCISAFVGADLVCAALAVGMAELKSSVLLVDIGTNGEMALLSGDRLTVCSTAAGPAFEGVGISMGMRGGEGAIDRVEIVNGALKPHVIGGKAARGICGSGLVDAVACLLDIEELEDTGYLSTDPFMLAPLVALTGRDVREVQLAKSAICAGVETLLLRCGVTAEDLSAVYIAGGFGAYLDMHNAARIGLLPRAVARAATVVGNAALEGASMLLCDRTAGEKATMMAKNAVTLSLATDASFAERYMMGMIFCSE